MQERARVSDLGDAIRGLAAQAVKISPKLHLQSLPDQQSLALPSTLPFTLAPSCAHPSPLLLLHPPHSPCLPPLFAACTARPDASLAKLSTLRPKHL